MKPQNLLSSINKYRPQIMGFAALWILVYHEWQTISPEWSMPYYCERFIKDIGFIGVDIFLLLSGMGLTYAIGKYSLGQFYLRRYKKLVIPVLTAGLLRLVISRWPLSYLVKCLCGYTFLTSDVTAFIWYVYAIAVFYLLFPLYWKLFDLFKNKYLFFLLSLGVWGIAVFALRNLLRDTSWLVLNRIPVFLLGILFGRMEQNGERPVDKRTALIVSAAALITGLALEYVCSVYGMKLLVPMPNVFLPALLVGVSLVLLLAGLFEKIGKRVKFLLFLGGISLELYCLQEVMGDFFIPFLSSRLPAVVVNIVFFSILTVCAWLLHKLNEKTMY